MLKKMECIVQAVGKGANEIRREVYNGSTALISRPLQAMRVLGGQLKGNQTSRFEIQQRVRAGRKAFYTLAPLWWKGVPFKNKKQIFVNGVDNHFLSGLAHRNLTQGDLLILDKARSCLVRKVMAGKACEKFKDEKGNIIQHRSLSNKKVMQEFGILDTGTTLTTLRIKRYQKWAVSPEHHSQTLAAFFGTSNCEVEGPFLADGSFSPSAHPWVKRMKADLDFLAEKSDELESLWQHHSRGVLAFLWTLLKNFP